MGLTSLREYITICCPQVAASALSLTLPTCFRELLEGVQRAALPGDENGGGFGPFEWLRRLVVLRQIVIFAPRILVAARAESAGSFLGVKESGRSDSKGFLELKPNCLRPTRVPTFRCLGWFSVRTPILAVVVAPCPNLPGGPNPVPTSAGGWGHGKPFIFNSVPNLSPWSQPFSIHS